MATARVVILGGGLAGLAAGVRLNEAGFAVTLIEKRNVLGGRASSFTPPGETERIDNCQHVLLGCCTNLLDFFARTKCLHQIKFYRRFDFLGERGCASLAASPLPAPLHFLPSILRFGHLRSEDRKSLVRAILGILRTRQPYPDVPFIDWLKAHNQSDAVIRNFWHPIMVSALNEDLERLSIRPAFHVIVDSFVRNRKGYQMGVPNAPLSELYSTERMGAWMDIRLGVAAASLETANDSVQCVMLPDNERLQADFYLSAMPPQALRSLLGAQAREVWQELNGWSDLEWSPITGVHLWYDRQVMRLPHAVVVGKTVQWIFNKSSVEDGSDANGQYIQVVISASRSLLSMRREEILEVVQADLRDILPETKSANLQRTVVVKVAESTPHIPPGSEANRAGPATPYSNLFLAGDWTATGWPPTMESAVRSGYRAAECITAAAGSEKKCVVADLPTDALAKLFLA